MKDINIVIDSQTHKVQFPDNFLGLNAENLQGNINFTFTNGFVNGIARLELSIDCESGFIPNLQNTGDSYTLPILSSLLTSDNIVMQLVIEQTDLITYKLTTDTSINNQKTYYTRSGVEGEYVYTIVENPKVADIGTYYEAQIPIFKTHIFNMTVGESINAVNTIPDDYPTWIDTLNSLVGQVNAKIIEMNQALAEVDNLDITATKEGTTVTITITRKDGSQQVVTLTDGKDGVGIEKIEKTGTNLLVDTYTIYYTDDSTSTFQVKNGRGIVSIDKTDTNILTDTYTITYNDNTTSTFYVVNGNGVESIVKMGTSGLIDTYRISYTNGEYYDYQVANGNGIDNIQKTDTTGLVDTYTITYTNGTTSTYIITNGNGISSIAKTGTEDNVDTYTITFTDGTTSTFTVTNSTVTDQEFQELQRLVDYNALYANALIKMNNSGTDLTINDTANAPMPMKLAPSVLEQETTTGKNQIGLQNLSSTTRNGLTFSIDDNVITINGTATSKVDFQKMLFNLTQNTSKTLKFYLDSGTFTAGAIGIHLNESDFTQISFIQINYNTTDLTSTKTIDLTNVNQVWLYAINGSVFNNAKFKVMLSDNTDDTYEHYTGGIPAPNPDYPQDIHTISGDNEIKVENINLWNEKWEIGGYNTTTGIKDTSQDKIRNKNKISCKENTQYYICINNNESTNTLRLLYYDKNNNLLSTVASIRNTIITTPKNTAYINFMLTVAYGTTYKKDICINISNTSINGNYYPHQEQSLPLNLGNLEYCKIGNYEDGFVIPDNQLFDGQLEKGKYLGTNGEKAVDNNSIRNVNPILVKSNQNYIFSNANTGVALNIFEYKEDMTFIKTSVIPANDSFITDNNTKYINFYKSDNLSSYTIMLNEGTTALPYEPYNPNGKWYLKKNIGKVVLNGSENWSYNSVNELFVLPYSNYNTNYNIPYSNYYVGQGIVSAYNQVNNNSVAFLSSRTRLFIKNTNYTNATDFCAWLSTHNTELYYVLATPEYILLNDTLQSQLTEIYKLVKAYQEQTNISQVNNDLPFIINTITCYDLNKLLTRVEVLESEV